MEHPWEGGTKVYINGLGHMTKIVVMVEEAFWNQKSDELKAWHTALGIEVLHLHLRFYGKVKFGILCLKMGKMSLYHTVNLNLI